MIKIISFLTLHYDEIIAVIAALIVIAEVITNLTPTEKDNSIVLKIKTWFDAIVPNRAKSTDPNTTARHKAGSRLITRIKDRINANRSAK